MSLKWERAYPYICALMAGAVWYYFSPAFPQKDSIFSATLTVSGIFIGFLSTSKAILLTTHSQVMDDLKKSGYVDLLISYSSEAIWVNLLFCVIDIAAFFCDSCSRTFSTIWILFGTCSLLAFFRVTQITLKLYKYSSRM